MRRALALAEQGWGQTAPNPMVGAVVVRDGRVVGAGYHRRYGGPHAEVEALGAAGDAARGATLYVTLEPCTHYGKTPPCVDAIIAAGVARVVAAVADPSPEAGGGAQRLRAAGIDCMVGSLEAEARELNAPFFHSFTSDRPWVTLKLAVSLDGAIADASRKPGRLTGDDARRETHRLRAGHDAIAVGIGTALADDPALTVRDWPAPRVPPIRVVFDRRARLPLGGQLARTAREAPTWVVTASPAALDGDARARTAALQAAGLEVLAANAIPAALRALRGKGVRSILLEGGAHLAGDFLRHA
jgi:diaminohydroxyphosphoribosylaminopyrimidine deaminase/5-amino-6-(5-phosphoribosylamino)uracil reductase